MAEALRSVLFELLKYQMEINKVNELKKIARASISDGQAREQKLNNARLGKLTSTSSIQYGTDPFLS